MIGNNKDIIAGDGSTNIQGNKVTVNQQNGMDYMQVRQVAMDIFKSNFYDLGEKVEKVINERAEEIINEYFDKLNQVAPEKLSNTEDPDIRFLVYEAQKNYARFGQKEMLDLLVDVLVNRTIEESDLLMKIVLNEAISIIPKLTNKQIDILSLIFICKYVNFNKEVPFEDYYHTFQPMIEHTEIPNGEIFFQHLQYSGCVSISIGSSEFNSIMMRKFPNLFNEKNVKQQIDTLCVSHEGLKYFKEQWDNTKLCNSSLTSVGLAIALININRKLGLDWNPGIWIRE